MIKVISTGSHGNCYILQVEGEILLLECGVTYKKILKALDFDLSNVKGCLISHEHKDHSKAIDQLIKNGINVYSSKGTFESLGVESYRAKTIKSEEQFKIGNFTILPFETEHDCEEPLGFLIHHKAIGKLLFATDTYYIKYKFKGLNHILVECNYDNKILETNVESGKVHPVLRGRIIKSHFSLDNLKDFLKASDLTQIKNIILIHLSSSNSCPDYFKTEIERATGKPVIVARDEMEIKEGI